MICINKDLTGFFATAFRYLAMILVVGLMTACESIPKIGGEKTVEPSEEVSETEEVGTEEGTAAIEVPFVVIPSPYLTNKSSVPSAAKEEFKQVKAAMKAKRWKDAENALTIMTETFPNLSGLYVNLGIVHREQNNFADAESAFKYAIETNGYNTNAYSQLGILYRQQGKFAKAESAYLKSLEVWPHDVDTLKNLGILYDLYMGRFPEALAQYELAAKVLGEEDRRLKGWIVDLKRRMPAEPVKAEEASANESEAAESQ